MLRKISRRFSSICAVENPYCFDIVAELPYLEPEEAQEKLERSTKFQQSWKLTQLDERISVLRKALDFIIENKAEFSKDITQCMGKPLAQAEDELDRTKFLAEGIIDQVQDALADHVIEDVPGRLRMIRKEPVGIVFQIAPWNFPYISVINTLSSAILSGNSVLIKHSSHSPLVGEHISEAFEAAGVPDLVQSCFLEREMIAQFLENPEIGYVQAVASTNSGRILYEEIANQRFIDVGLELGGKDSAFIAKDVDLDDAVSSVVRGALYNSGQSASSIERIYVEDEIYDDFLDKAEIICNSQVLGDPMDVNTTMGPMCLPDTPDLLKQRVRDAINAGAHILAGGTSREDESGMGRFFAPTLIADVDDTMDLFRLENFGPIVSVTPVKSEEEAIVRMNTNTQGISNAIYTKDRDLALRMAYKLQSGTVYQNTCNRFDPYLGWTGLKDSGKGTTSGMIGFSHVTKPKAFNFVGQLN